jgi:phosphoribosylglycinamide formyltransferase-1
MSMRVAVAASGKGSNLAALIRELPPGSPAEVVLVLSNRKDAGAVGLAHAHGIATAILPDPADPTGWLEPLRAHAIDFVVLAGYLKRVPAEVIRAYPDRIINIHPALLPRYGGAGMYGHHVHQAVLAHGDRESGATVHVVSEQYDEGPILARARVPVLPGDTPEILAGRVLTVEHRLLPAAVKKAAESGRAVPFDFPSPSPSPSPSPISSEAP